MADLLAGIILALGAGYIGLWIASRLFFGMVWTLMVIHNKISRSLRWLNSVL